jgi:hypothetical protein
MAEGGVILENFEQAYQDLLKAETQLHLCVLDLKNGKQPNEKDQRQERR